ncbi:MAG TPA: ribosome maturation factor RimM [Gaiellaceae bacterium]|nr:ribosome maturation factor RimM [Gaiellaceae bacterium]
MSGRGEDWVTVGRVGRPHGLDGSFVVEHPSERLAAGSEVWAGDERAKVVSAKRVGGGRLAVRLDRPAERGTELRVPRAALPEPAEGAYYVFQLVGLEVVERGGRSLGTVAQVAPYPANDVLELDSGPLLPLVEDCVLEVDLEQGRIVVAEGFAEPA